MHWLDFFSLNLVKVNNTNSPVGATPEPTAKVLRTNDIYHIVRARIFVKASDQLPFGPNYGFDRFIPVFPGLQMIQGALISILRF
ncbi:hypothetical protein ACVWZB_004835 [Paenibacillus polymyxa]